MRDQVLHIDRFIPPPDVETEIVGKRFTVWMMLYTSAMPTVEVRSRAIYISLKGFTYNIDAPWRLDVHSASCGTRNNVVRIDVLKDGEK